MDPRDDEGRPELDPPLPLEMVAQFEVIESDPETAVSSGLYSIRTVGQANDAVARIRQHRDRLAEAEAFADEQMRRLAEQRQRVSAWIDDEREQVEASCRVLEALLEVYATGRVEESDRKSVKLLAGELQFRKQPDVYVFEKGRFLAWAKAAKRTDLIRQPDPEPDRNAVKKLFKLADPNADGGTTTDLVDPLTGEAVAGVTVTIGEDAFTVHTPEVDR